MPSKLFIHIEPESSLIAETSDFVELCRLPLVEGAVGPYLVQAKGIAGPQGGVATMRLKLDVFGYFGELLTSQQSEYLNERQQFVLTAAATLPAERGGGTIPPPGGGGTIPPPGASANLSVWATPGQVVFVWDVVIIALSVDEIVTA